MKTANSKLLKAPPNPYKSFAAESERIPNDFFDPLAKKQNEFKVPMMLVACLNSYIRNPLFPGKLAARRAR